MSNRAKGSVIKAIALTLDISAPLIATLTQFPVWVKQSAEATVSGVVIVLVFFSCLPFIKQIQAFIKSPSVPILWLVIFVFLSLLENIIDQMIVVCFVGTIANAIGTFIYKIGDNISKRED